MHISWLGNSAVRIQTKPSNEDITVVIDAYKTKEGTFPKSLAPQIALFSHGEENAITLSGKPFILSNPGECETHGVLISAIEGKKENDMIIRIDTEGLSLVHLGATNKEPTNEQLEDIGEVDILCISVGGDGAGFDPATAVKVINAIEPRIVIPIYTQSDTSPKALPVSAFIKEMGVQPRNEEKKVILKKKDLPEEDMQVIVISKE